MHSRQRQEFAVTHIMVLKLAIPMTLAYMSTPLLGLVDTAVVGRLGDPALIGGLAVGAVIIDLVFTTFNFLRSGTTGLTAQALGAGDEKEKQAILIRALLISLFSGIAMIVLCWPVLKLGLYFMDISGEIAAATSSYFLIRILSAPFALANYAILGWMIGLGRAGSGLVLQFILNGTNIVFSIVLGLTLGWGLTGVAFATLIGEFIAAIIGILWCLRLADRTLRPSRARIFVGDAFWRLAELNGNIMLRSFCLLFAFAYFTSQGARFGELTLAANAILMHLFIIGGYFLDGQATAAEQIVGRSIGANYKTGFTRGIVLTAWWSFIQCLVLSGIYFLGGSAIIALLTTIDNVRAEAMHYLPWAAITPLTGMLAFLMDGVFIGATWSRDMGRMMVFSLAVYLLSWWLLRDSLGNDGLWLALNIFLVVRGLSLIAWLPLRMRKVFG